MTLEELEEEVIADLKLGSLDAEAMRIILKSAYLIGKIDQLNDFDKTVSDRMKGLLANED